MHDCEKNLHDKRISHMILLAVMILILVNISICKWHNNYAGQWVFTHHLLK